MRALMYETKNKGGCGKIVGSFEVRFAIEVSRDPNIEEWARRGCLSLEELRAYIRKGGGKCYAWIIIPKTLNIFSPLHERPDAVPISWGYYKKMPDCVLLSVHKKYADLILQGKKTVEFRKTAPREIKEGK